MKYFVDTNLIIDFFKKEPTAIDKLTKTAQDDESELFVNRLVYLESLRTIDIKHTQVFQKSKQVFDMFEFLDIGHEIYDKAIGFSRHCRAKGISLKGRCEAIDFLHFITAKHYQLEILARDSDMDKLAAAYEDWTKP